MDFVIKTVKCKYDDLTIRFFVRQKRNLISFIVNYPLDYLWLDVYFIIEKIIKPGDCKPTQMSS